MGSEPLLYIECYEPFPKPVTLVLPMSRLAQPRLDGPVPLADSRSDLMHSQCRLSVQILPAACDRLHAVILQEPGDHVPRISENFYTYTDGNNLAILLNKDTFVPNSASSPSQKPPQAKTHGDLLLLSYVALASPFRCRLTHGHVLFSPLPHLDLLLRLREHMINHSVDFIGVDFNISAFFTVGGVFSDPEFAALGNLLLWELGGLDETCHECMTVEKHLHLTNLHERSYRLPRHANQCRDICSVHYSQEVSSVFFNPRLAGTEQFKMLFSCIFLFTNWWR